MWELQVILVIYSESQKFHLIFQVYKNEVKPRNLRGFTFYSVLNRFCINAYKLIFSWCKHATKALHVACLCQKSWCNQYCICIYCYYLQSMSGRLRQRVRVQELPNREICYPYSVVRDYAERDVTALTFPQGLTPGIYISKMTDNNKRITVLQLTYRPW